MSTFPRNHTIGLLHYDICVKTSGAMLQPLKRSQPAITCSKLTIETLEQGVKYLQS